MKVAFLSIQIQVISLVLNKFFITNAYYHAFDFSRQHASCLCEVINVNTATHPAQNTARQQSFFSSLISTKIRYSRLSMVRNVDLPEALVFYGIESVFEPLKRVENEPLSMRLRPGILRLLHECQEVGTSALILSELNHIVEKDLKNCFIEAWDKTPSDTRNQFNEKRSVQNRNLLTQMEEIDPIIVFRCFDSPSFTESVDMTQNRFYNLKLRGISPSPAFLLDALQSIHINPRGFGGSSGFGRGQWIEPRRNPMPARTVVFVAGDWTINEQNITLQLNMQSLLNNYCKNESKPKVGDRCAAARAAGCRVIYIEHLSNNKPQEVITIEEDTQAMSICDMVISTYGNDNPRNINPITLDAISTPGDYWLNPPTPRDGAGNSVSIDQLVELFRSYRETEKIGILVDDASLKGEHSSDASNLSNEEIDEILADMDPL